MTIIKKFGGHGWMRVSEWPRWSPITPIYHLLGLKAPKGHLVLAHKPDAFHSFMGLCSSWWCFLFPRCKWSECDSCPFHHKDPNTYATSSHVLIQSQYTYLYGCHIWHQRCEIPLIHINGVWFSSHKGASCLGYHKFANMWRFGGMDQMPYEQSFSCIC